MRRKRTNMETGYFHILNNLPQKSVSLHVYVNIYGNIHTSLSIHRLEHTRLTIVVISGLGVGFMKNKKR